jgi:hypothetical protein
LNIVLPRDWIAILAELSLPISSQARVIFFLWGILDRIEATRQRAKATRNTNEAGKDVIVVVIKV